MDKRTIKTVGAIRKAFNELIIEQDDVMFTIKEITYKAKINRKTFYLHFNSIEDLYLDLENRIEKEVFKILESKGFFDEKFSLKTVLDGLLELIDSNPPLYEKLLVQDNYKFLFRNVKDRIKEKLIQHFFSSNTLTTQLKAEYMVTGLMKMFRVWSKNREEMSKEELCNLAYSIINSGITSKN